MVSEVLVVSFGRCHGDVNAIKSSGTAIHKTYPLIP